MPRVGSASVRQAHPRKVRLRLLLLLWPEKPGGEGQPERAQVLPSCNREATKAGKALAQGALTPQGHRCAGGVQGGGHARGRTIARGLPAAKV